MMMTREVRQWHRHTDLATHGQRLEHGVSISEKLCTSGSIRTLDTVNRATQSSILLVCITLCLVFEMPDNA